MSIRVGDVVLVGQVLNFGLFIPLEEGKDQAPRYQRCPNGTWVVGFHEGMMVRTGERVEFPDDLRVLVYQLNTGSLEYERIPFDIPELDITRYRQ